MAGKKKTRSAPKRDLKQLEIEHAALKPLLEQLDIELHRQMVRLLGQASIPLGFPIQHRVKAWPSIAEKLERVPLSLTSVRSMQDLVGFRVVLQFRRDVDRVCAILEDNLKIVEKYDTIERLREDQFGYSSIHFVIEVPPSWLAVPTVSGLAGLRAEVQVRTIAQHIWAEASQTLQYKIQEAVPNALKRSIYRVSALLETVDLEFERVLTDREAYRARIANAPIATGPLNVDLLERLLDAAWPAANKEPGAEIYADLLGDLGALGVTTSDMLQKVLSTWHDSALADDSKIIEELRSNPIGSHYFNDETRTAPACSTHMWDSLVRVSRGSSGRPGKIMLAKGSSALLRCKCCYGLSSNCMDTDR